MKFMGLSVPALAKIMKVRRQYVYNYLNDYADGRFPKIETIRKFGKALNFDVLVTLKAYDPNARPKA